MSGPLPAWLAPLTQPGARAYGWVVGRRNRRYDAGRGVHDVSIPVVSIGNITTGGVGKTPVVAWIAERLSAEGWRPVIVMRGYGARPGGVSDEAAEYARRLPGIDVLADPDRVRALERYLPDHPAADVVLMDDGFQHRRLGRAVDLVLIDATRSGLADRLLPAGHLREPVGSLRRADAVVVTRAERFDPGLADRIAEVHGRPPLAWSAHRSRGIDVHDAGGVRREPADWLRGRSVATLFGVGHPGAVRSTLAATGVTVVRDLPARDHERYSRAGLERLVPRLSGAELLVVTGKDWAKMEALIDFDRWPVPIVVPDLEIDVWQGAEELLSLVRSSLRPPAERSCPPS